MSTILVVDDDSLVRNGVKRLLSQNGFQTETASDGFEALNLLHRSVPDLMLLDLDMPGITGLELLHLVKRDGIQPRTAILTAKPSIDTALEAGRLKVVDYFIKPLDLHTIDRIRDILDNKSVPPACMTVEERIKSILEGHGLAPRVHPTILSLYASGGTNREIGEKLGLSWSTVRSHIRQAMSAFEVGSRTELVSAIIHEFSKV
ncbi:MAG: response regulator transcription factor [Deltaproteobacteria bacterium]|nr:response regulator transcription factor [Deltaproteobacteria bacterium]